VINLGIVTELTRRGIAKVDLKQQLSPAWTTDWLSDKGRAKLEAYGIAPPNPAGGPDRCPRCNSSHVERISQFGSTPCKAQWRCTDCLEPFDYFKCI
jgi:ring-1,2-phenylacetyl-CoA epoxidase subunit PaaD